MIPLTLIAKDYDPFPCLESLWSIYSKKGIKTVFISLGASKSCIPDLELAETLGCPLNIAPANEEQTAMWLETKEVLVSRTRSDAKFEFSQGAEDRWIVPKNFRMKTFPKFWGSGPRDSEPLNIWVQSICFDMGLTESRIDVLKIDLGNGDEREALLAVLDAGFRPGCILVNWSHMPDTNVPTTLTAGHLQNTGYKLIAKYDTKFLYFFTDRDLYMTCSWEDASCPNPMVAEIIKMIPRVREANDCSKRLATTGKTEPPPESKKTESESQSVQ
jgi:hypothetical protein